MLHILFDGSTSSEGVCVSATMAGAVTSGQKMDKLFNDVLYTVIISIKIIIMINFKCKITP